LVEVGHRVLGLGAWGWGSGFRTKPSCRLSVVRCQV
jgi:hypothetical protein